MNITDFEVPKEHPYGMLEDFHLEHTYEAESLLVWILKQCIEAGEFTSIRTKLRHPRLVEVGLLAEAKDGYWLTRKAIGLLWAYYGKE